MNYDPEPIYTNNRPFAPADKAVQIRHLALIGIAASDSVNSVKNLDSAFESLLEVIVKLAYEVEVDLDAIATADNRSATQSRAERLDRSPGVPPINP